MEIRIRKAGPSDVEPIVGIIEEAARGLTDSTWFVPDDESFVRQHIETETESFTLTAWGDKMAGYVIVRHPGQEEDNLGVYLDEYQQQETTGDRHLPENVFHIESAAVSSQYAGLHIQYRLMEAAEQVLREKKKGPLWLCGTVHPDNKKSLHTFQRLGYEITACAEKYGGLKRYIMAKKI